MSSPFNYEIDEKNLRSRLREMSVPYREDAWIQFESYSEYNKSAQRSRPLPEFSLNLSRNIVIPVAFGCAILLLSFILYKFIDIKNDQTAEVKEQVTPPTSSVPEKEKVKVVPIDTIKKEAPVVDTTTLVSTPIPSPVIVPTLATTASVTPVASVAVSPSVANTELKAISAWYIHTSGDLYESPNVASKIIGSIIGGKNYPVYEITNYFIKTKDAAGNYGYVLKRLTGTAETQTNSLPKKKKTAEEMESKPLNTLLPTSTPFEDEPQLK